MNYAITLTLIVAAVPATLAVLVYGLGAPWWRSLTGATMLGLTTCLAVILDLSVAVRILGRPFPGLVEVALVLYAGVAVFLWLLLALVVRAQLLPRRR